MRRVVRVLGLCAVLCCQTGPDFAPPSERTDPATLGELVYRILHEQLEHAETCGPASAATLALDRERFVRTFDRAITEGVPDSAPDLLGGTLVPAIDRGDLPRLTTTLAESLALLVDDELDPERRALRSSLEVARARTVLERSHALSLARRVLRDPRLSERIHAMARLSRVEVGSGDVASASLRIAGRALSPSAPSACEAPTEVDLASLLLRTEGYEPVDAGAPAWTLRADAFGNPRVRASSIDGRLPPPFVDEDADGIADVDARRRQVDARGAPISISAFGAAGDQSHDNQRVDSDGYDEHGRALGPDGRPLFETFDAKQTTLAHVLQLGREALEAGIHRDALRVSEAILGTPNICEDDPTFCATYEGTAQPLADAAHLGLELARHERAQALLRTGATLLEEEPETAEEILVTFGQLLIALDGVDEDLREGELLATLEALMPLLGRIAESGEGATLRLLLETIEEHAESGNVAAELGLIVDHRRLLKDPECSDAAPDGGERVDWSAPRRIEDGDVRIDNRSAAEQAIELVTAADCGDVPFSGDKTVAHVVLGIMADLEEDQVCTLIDRLLRTLDIVPNAGDFVAGRSLDLIGCEGDAVLSHLRALDALAKSGALDLLLPLARVFDERDQLPLLLELLTFLADDLSRDDDDDARTRSAVRRVLPAASAILASDVPARLFALLKRLRAIEVSDGEGSLADALVDLTTYVLVQREVAGHDGPLPERSLGEALVVALRRILERAEEDESRAALRRIGAHIGGYLRRTEVEGEHLRLAHRNLVPLARTLAEGLRDATALPRDDYLCWVSETQASSSRLLTGRDVAELLHVAGALRDQPDSAVLERWAHELLTPMPERPDEETYGPALQVVAALLESDLDVDLDPLLALAGALAMRHSEDGAELLAIVDRSLAADEEGALLAIGENLVTRPRGDAPRLSPLEIFLDIGDRVTDVTPPVCEVDPERRFSVAEADAMVQGVVDFLGDDVQGLGAIYELVGKRRGGPFARRETDE